MRLTMLLGVMLATSTAFNAYAYTALDAYKYLGIAYVEDRLCGIKTSPERMKVMFEMLGVTPDDVQENLQIVKNWSDAALREAKRKGVGRWCVEMQRAQ